MGAERIAIVAQEISAKKAGDSGLRERIASFFSQDIVIGVVGYAGSGNSNVADLFAQILRDEGFSVPVLRARHVLESWAEKQGCQNPTTIGDARQKVEAYQNLGDELREQSGEYGAVAGMMAMEVHGLREKGKIDETQIFILDSLKHPAEVELLRQIYGDGFRLIGVGCRPDIREKRGLQKKTVG